MAMPLVELQDVSFSYHRRNVISNLSLKVNDGDFVAVLGGNGSGKSTLAKLLNAIIEPTEGKILIDGKEEKDVYRTRRMIGLVLQDPDSQIVADTVEDDVAFGPENLGLESGEIQKRVKESLELCGIADLSAVNPTRLSGGQKQLVAIAGVLALKPRCLVLDEATAMLDPEGRELVLSAIRELNGNGVAIVLMTHDSEEAAMADDVVVLDQGKLVIQGSKEQVFSSNNQLDKFGVDIPIAYKFINALKNNGIMLNKDTNNTDKLVYELENRRKRC